MSATEDNNFLYQLIESVKNHRCLYERRNAFYFNKLEKNRAWEEVAKECNETGTECRGKWKSLRERYSRELRKSNIPAYSQTNEWELFNKMTFLRSSMRSKNKEKLYKEEEFEEEESISFSDNSIQPGPSSSSTAKRTITALNDSCEQHENIAQGHEGPPFVAPTQIIHSTSSDGDAEFLSAILPLMRELPSGAKDDFKAEMMTRLVQIRKECREAGSFL